MAKHAVVVLDATGSMRGQEERVVSSMNEYAAALPGKCSLTVFMFDSNRWEKFYSGAAKAWREMRVADYRPGAMTPLYDSIGKALDHARKKSSKGDKVMVMIDTDGFENASTDHTRESIVSLIEKCKAKGWAFQFMANALTEQEAAQVAAVGKSLGMQTRPAAYAMRSSSYQAAACDTVSYFGGDDAGNDGGGKKKPKPTGRAYSSRTAA